MRYILIIGILFLSTGFYSCITSRVPEGQLLLDKMSTDQILVVVDSVDIDSSAILFKLNKYPGKLPIKPFRISSNKSPTELFLEYLSSIYFYIPV